MSEGKKINQVDYDVLDRAKNRFIRAAQSTLDFASDYGFVPNRGLGASANVFSFDLSSYKGDRKNIQMSLLPEGLGTADDARPEEMTDEEAYRFWYNIGVKVVSTMTNDAASSGLQSILISLYMPSSTPELVFTTEFLDGFLDGFVDSCRKVGCVYLSGETPQLKSKMIDGALDLAGAVWCVEYPEHPPVTSTQLKAGNQIVLIESSGPHENGFTPLRTLAKTLPNGYREKMNNGVEFWKAMNAPSVLYTPAVRAVLESGVVPTALQNITGHGWMKLMRSEKPLRYVIDTMLPIPEVFRFAQEKMGISSGEMVRVFNYGAGFAIYTRDVKDAEKAVNAVKSLGLHAVHAGYIEDAEVRSVFIRELDETIAGDDFLLKG